jgi:hypothetical protein
MRVCVADDGVGHSALDDVDRLPWALSELKENAVVGDGGWAAAAAGVKEHKVRRAYRVARARAPPSPRPLCAGQDLFAKLKFTFLELDAKDRFLRELLGDAPLQPPEEVAALGLSRPARWRAHLALTRAHVRAPHRGGRRGAQAGAAGGQGPVRGGPESAADADR